MKISSLNFVWIGIVFCFLILAAGICSASTIIIPYADSGYKYQVVNPGEGTGFESPGYNDSGFSTGNASFGTTFGCDLNSGVKTEWPAMTDILVRKKFNLSADTQNLKVYVAIDNDVQIFVNGHDISGGMQTHEGCPTLDSFEFSVNDSILKTGENLIAIRGRDRGSSSFLDIEVIADVPVSGTNLYVSNNAPSSIERGDTLTYTLHFKNFGRSTASDVVLEDTFPLDVEFISASDGGIYDSNMQKVTWNIGSVSAFPSGKGFRTVTVRIPENFPVSTAIQNTASISTTTPETTYDDNSAVAKTLVTGLNLPLGVNIEPLAGDAGGMPSVYWMNPITFTYQTNNSVVKGVNITIHVDDGGTDITGIMNGTQTYNTTTWTYTAVLYPRHGAATVTYTEQFDSNPYTPSYDIRGDYGDFVTADTIYNHIKDKYPQSPMLSEPDIGSRFKNAASTYGIDPVCLVAFAETASQFGTIGWAAEHPEAHNAFLYGVYYNNTTIDQINSASSWGDMVNRVACAIATGPNYFTKGHYTIDTIIDASYNGYSTQKLYAASLDEGSAFPGNLLESGLFGLIWLSKFNPEDVLEEAALMLLEAKLEQAEYANQITKEEIEHQVIHDLFPSNLAYRLTFVIYIDPAGYIYNTNTGERIQGATVWLQCPDGQGGWENVPTGQTPAISQPDTNPLITNNAGQYQWDVLEGAYRVHVEADGYYPADSIFVNIPPPVTDLHVGLTKIPSANPPVADANGPYTGNEGSPITLDASGSTDSDGDVLHYRWDFNNDGIWDTFWQSTLTATYTWYDDFSGTVKVEVSDGTTTDNATASVTVTNVAPTVNAGPDRTVNEGETVVFSSNFSDPGSLDIHSKSWNFGDGSNISEIPIHIYKNGGVYTVSFTVTDDDGGIGTDTLIVTVNNVDKSPQLVPIGNKSVKENELLTFNIAASDADGDAITYSATNLPTGANFDATTATFSWTPATGSEGIYNVTFIATANSRNDSETITITVGDWNPWNDPDSAGGESITLVELQEAIYDWRFGIALPNGEKVDLPRLQGLIYSWRFG